VLENKKKATEIIIPPPPFKRKTALFQLLNTMQIKKVNAICSYSFTKSHKRKTG
jgi:hypothetical protein